MPPADASVCRAPEQGCSAQAGIRRSLPIAGVLVPALALLWVFLTPHSASGHATTVVAAQAPLDVSAAAETEADIDSAAGAPSPSLQNSASGLVGTQLSGRIPAQFDPSQAVAINAITTQTIEITTSSGTRTAVVHVPVLSADARPALLIALHGSSSSGAALEDTSGLDDVADRHGFIVAYPDGALIDGDRSWNSGQCCEPATSAQVDDVRFLGTAIDALMAAYPIDRNRVFVIGHSNGAIMAQELACRMADRVAAVVSVSGALDDSAACNPSQPVSVLEIHGTADENVPYEYGQEAAWSWQHMDSCAATAPVEQVDQFVVTSWTQCANDTTVELATIDGGPHAWPSGAGELAWAFFSDRSL
jgi:polyhydroxybutyrate depolymerase